MWKIFFNALSSLRLTVVCLACALILVFCGTLAQVHYGIHTVQDRYFHSFLVMWPEDSISWKIPIFPGGHLIGAVLLLNLIAAHVRRFQWKVSKIGIQLTHLGLIVMLLGGLFTDLFSVESYLRLTAGETKNYSEDSLRAELAVIDESDPELDQVTAIPDTKLSHGGVIQHPSLPFTLFIRHFYWNSELQMLDKAGAKPVPAADRGVGSRLVVTEIPRSTEVDGRDTESVVVEIVPPPGPNEITANSLGTWLVSDGLGAPQRFSWAGKSWRLELRPRRYYKPYSVTLRKFTHERYPGTEVPKNFASRITLIDPEFRENRDILIYMNHPWRYRGETFYQSGFDKGDTASIFQVVRNPSFIAPYAACAIVGLGLLIQFAFHFVNFTRRRKNKNIT